MLCTNLPPYMIISLSKSKRVYSCISCVHEKYSDDFPDQHTLIEKLINDLKESFKADQTLNPQPIHDPQTSTNQCPSSPKVDIPIQSLLDTPTNVLPTTISDVSPTSPVIMTATAESTPTIVSPPPVTKTTTTVTNVPHPRAKPTTSHPCKFYMQGHCQYGRRGQSCPNSHPPMCFKFLRNGARGCNKLDCTYAHPKMCRMALTTGRCDRKNCFYYHKTGTIRPVPNNPNSGTTRPTIPLMELNIPPYPSRSHKVSPPLTSTSMFHNQNPNTNQPQAQVTRWDLSTAPQEPHPQSHPPINYQHYPTQCPTIEPITPQDSSNSNFHSATYPFLDQMKVIKRLMLDMQQVQSKLLQTMSQAWPCLPQPKAN